MNQLFNTVNYFEFQAFLAAAANGFRNSPLLPVSNMLYYRTMKLRLVVENDPETKRWAAFFPELPGCASAGDTEEEAIQNAKEALELWFEPAPVNLSVGAKVLEVALT